MRPLFLVLLSFFLVFIQSCGISSPETNVGRILGEIRDTNGFFLPSTRVGIVGMANETTSDREGKFLLSYVPVGTVTVVATRGSISITSRVKVEKDITTEGVIIVFTEADQVAPTLSNIQVTGIGDNSATVSWNTSEPATGKVEYGLFENYGSSTAEITTLTASHSHSITGLMAKTLYHYRVKNKDAAGNEVTSADFIFTTTSGTPPAVPTGLAIAAPQTPGSLNFLQARLPPISPGNREKTPMFFQEISWWISAFF